MMELENLLPKKEYDVLVVGAGPAGLSSALFAARRGVRVLVLESKSTIGTPVCCAEFVPALLGSFFPLKEKHIAWAIEGTRIFVGGEEIQSRASPGYILERSSLEKDLAMEAARAGAQIFVGSRVLSIEDGAVIFINLGKRRSVKARVIIGADGPESTVGACFGQGSRYHLFCLQVEIPLREKFRNTEIYFDRHYRGGYAWLFPKGALAKVGLGLRAEQKKELSSLLSRHIASLEHSGRIIPGSILDMVAGRIPTTGPVEKTAGPSWLLAGDAAGQTDPVTGGGIPQALICGRLAGEAPPRSAMEKDARLLVEYEKSWKDLYGVALERAVKKREEMDRCWHDRDFASVIRRCWMTFQECYR